MTNLCSGSPPNRNAFSALGACALVPLVMQTHMAAAPAVVEQACAAVHNLAAYSNSNKTLLADAGMCELLLLALQTHASRSDAAGLVEKAVVAVRNMASDNAINYKLGELGACEVVVRAVRLHWWCAGVVDQGCVALYNLSLNSKNNALCGVAVCRLVSCRVYAGKRINHLLIVSSVSICCCSVILLFCCFVRIMLTHTNRRLNSRRCTPRMHMCRTRCSR